MTALPLLHRSIEALDRELKALAGYTDSELQELCDLLEALREHKRAIQNEAGRRELSGNPYAPRR